MRIIFYFNQWKFSIFFLTFFNLCSCEINCEHETKIYNQSWNDKVISIYRDNDHKATYIIKTNRQLISISPTQEVIWYAENGDSLVKKPNSFFVDVYRDGEFIFTSRVSSPTCDSIVLMEKLK